jgi:hypothetical protein
MLGLEFTNVQEFESDNDLSSFISISHLLLHGVTPSDPYPSLSDHFFLTPSPLLSLLKQHLESPSLIGTIDRKATMGDVHPITVALGRGGHFLSLRRGFP